ncbi:MAG: efflux RND transporter periplasmic adaptor subunit [Pseudomonadales bacterium]|nr:efflux RND transporter periplasmic adaptor subunit [Pseudomonadales bacterium]
MNSINALKMTAVLMVGVGIGAGIAFTPNNFLSRGSEVQVMEPVMEPEQEIKPLFYRSPMNPNITSPVPAKGPMGMDYLPVYADKSKAKESAATVTIDPVVMQNMGVRTALAKRMPMSRTIRALGKIGFNEEGMVRIHPRVDGWVENMWANKEGQIVKKNDLLLSIYSPQILATQQEYILALNNLEALKESPVSGIKKTATELVNISRQRLVLLDVSDDQIREIERTKNTREYIKLHAKHEGTIIRIGSRAGQFVTPKTELYMMANLNTVWVNADIFEFELPWLKLGDEVEMTTASVPGRLFKGIVNYIYPYGEPNTRTVKVRLVFDNAEGLLRPEMFARVNIQAQMTKSNLVIPVAAVLRSGDTPQVFVALGGGAFEPRAVTLGLESNGNVAILEGVKAGEEVVVSAQFLLDSESKLNEATLKMMKSSDQQTGRVSLEPHDNKPAENVVNDLKGVGENVGVRTGVQHD